MVRVVDHLGGPTVGTQDEDRVGRSFVIVARTEGSWTDQGLLLAGKKWTGGWD